MRKSDWAVPLRLAPSFLWITLAGCAGRTVSPDPALDGPCRVPADTVTLTTPVDFLLGVFDVTMTSDQSLTPDVSARGRLWLWRTSFGDRSTRNDVVPAAGDTVAAPLYGAMSVDYGALNPHDRRSPMILVDTLPPTVDPIYPHVLARDRRAVWEGRPFRELSLVVNSESNRRDGVTILDGMGVGLFIERMDSTGFAGRWGSYGIADEGKGRYCATRIR